MLNNLRIQLSLILLICLQLLCFAGENATESHLSWPKDLPVYDHILIVIFENKDYQEVIGNPKAKYINQVLKKEGANFTKMYAEEHLSQGNYFWLFSGSNQGVGFDDKIPSAENKHYPFQASNLGFQLLKKGYSFKGYSESMPEIGFTGNHANSDYYARKHVPWISFGNLPNGKTIQDSCNLRFEDFPDSAHYDQLPTLAIVIPNMVNDMHNGSRTRSVPTGDHWLKVQLNAYYQWAKTHNSLLILTFDESSNESGYEGLTDPFLDQAACLSQGHAQEACENRVNRTITIIAGAHIQPGDYPEGQGINHVTLLRTLEAMYGLPKSGAQQPFAQKGGITDDKIITDIFKKASE